MHHFSALLSTEAFQNVERYHFGSTAKYCRVGENKGSTGHISLRWESLLCPEAVTWLLGCVDLQPCLGFLRARMVWGLEGIESVGADDEQKACSCCCLRGWVFSGAPRENNLGMKLERTQSQAECTAAHNSQVTPSLCETEADFVCGYRATGMRCFLQLMSMEHFLCMNKQQDKKEGYFR